MPSPWVLKGSGERGCVRTAQPLIDTPMTKALIDSALQEGILQVAVRLIMGPLRNSACESFSISRSHPGAGAVQAMVERGWISRGGEGRFCPEDTLSERKPRS